MPLFLKPITRREFIWESLAAGLMACSVPKLFSAMPDAHSAADPHRFFLLADTHIAADAYKKSRDVNMTSYFRRVVAELSTTSPRAAMAFVLGDVAFRKGKAGDYAAFLNWVQPVRELGIPVCLTLGNHDHRARFWANFPTGEGVSMVDDRRVAFVPAKRANFFILDSLDRTNETPGRCGERQLQWLEQQLDAHRDKPAITMVHHPFNREEEDSGLKDTEELMDIILPRKQVKAHIFGHTHDWNVTQKDGLHLINLPPTAYVFQKGRPSGWVDLTLGVNSATVQLHALDKTHPQHLQTVTLPWRAA